MEPNPQPWRKFMDIRMERATNDWWVSCFTQYQAWGKLIVNNGWKKKKDKIPPMVASWTHNCMVTQFSPTSSESFLGLFVLYMGPFFDVLSSRQRERLFFAEWNRFPTTLLKISNRKGSYHARKTISHIRNWTKRIFLFFFFTFIHII